MSRIIASTILLCALWISAAPAAAEPAGANPGYAAAPALIEGGSPDELGEWRVDYQRVIGGDAVIADRINEIIDAEARGQVATYEPSATKTNPWTLNIEGNLQFAPMTVSALFRGVYNTNMPNMPIETLATRVFDNRSGILLSWDNLFLDKQAGLNRLSAVTKAAMPGRQWGSEVAPVDDNFRYWLPTDDGIELHFPHGQFGRGVTVVSVPGAAIADLIAPVFAPLIPAPVA
ncbi:DUF3298 domain-containing protein [Mycolicibacterium confluentis]|uniref:DUF3298 domain-containing protein n=1 Tax=Mycolicibacterium confluentis TaxID=28047 RepID=A0A7I7Y0F3_9MYCO|nr:DUF3298 domain-containing protein [Mycolicibacterium confluentis]BBZ35108.1 hypothetical protein MCNF_37130 [Mycolicibacterium confluentis]